MTRAPFVVLVGPDGVGKTTVADALLERYGDRGRYFHFRPPLSPDGLSRRAGAGAPPPSKDVVPGPAFLGWARLVRSFVLFWLGYLRSVRPALRQGNVVVADRWAFGYLAQPAPLRFAGPPWLARLAIRLLPQPDLVVELRAPASVIRERKAELTLEQIEHEAAAWSALPARRLAAVDATAAVPDIVGRIEGLLPGLPARHVAVPPGGSLLAPLSSRRGYRAGLAMWAACRPLAAAFQRGQWVLVAVLGPRAALGRRLAWAPEMGPAAWESLLSAWVSVVGPVADVAVYRRSQQERTGMALLLLDRMGHPLGFAKCRPGAGGALLAEGEALARVGRGAQGFRAPRVLATGEAGGWSYLLTEALPPRLHRPAPPGTVSALAAEVTTVLSGVPRPPGIPLHWQPMHGDFGPWNVRLVPGSGVAVVDWEHAGWGPPGADLVFHWAGRRALRLRVGALPSGLDEAHRYWREEVERRMPANPRDRRLASGMLGALGTGP